MPLIVNCSYCGRANREIPGDEPCPVCSNGLDNPKTGTESSSVPAPKSVLSDEEFDKLVAQHSMPSLADIYKKGLKQNVLRPIGDYAHKN